MLSRRGWWAAEVGAISYCIRSWLRLVVLGVLLRLMILCRKRRNRRNSLVGMVLCPQMLGGFGSDCSGILALRGRRKGHAAHALAEAETRVKVLAANLGRSVCGWRVYDFIDVAGCTSRGCDGARTGDRREGMRFGGGVLPTGRIVDFYNLPHIAGCVRSPREGPQTGRGGRLRRTLAS